MNETIEERIYEDVRRRKQKNDNKFILKVLLYLLFSIIGSIAMIGYNSLFDNLFLSGMFGSALCSMLILLYENIKSYEEKENARKE